MATFNKSVKKGQASKGFVPTVNHEGATVHQMTDLETLFSQVLGSFFGESTHYESRVPAEEFKKLWERVQRISNEDKEYVLKIAEIGRMCNMISYPLNILSVVYNDERFLGTNFVDDKGRNRIWNYADKIILRAKDITTLMATQLAMFDNRSSEAITVKGKKGTAIPMQLRKTLRKKIQFYDKFKLSKGLSKGSDVTLADCIRLVRPKPKNDDFATFYKSIIDGDVKVGNDKAQIKTEFTKAGKASPTEKANITKAVHEDILQNIVKNLAALCDKDVFADREALASVCKRLRDPKEVKGSRLLPFRFYSAYKELDERGRTVAVRELKLALVEALDLSIENVEPFEGLTCILVDLSGSMDTSISGKSVLNAHEVASVLAAIAYKKGTADLFAFSDDCKRVDISQKASVMDIARAILNGVPSSGTDLAKALNTIETYAKKMGTKYDSLLMLSDNDCYGYDSRANTMSFGSRGWGRDADADSHMTRLISSGVFRKVWLNNLLGNSFAVFNTASDTKNLITGFSESCLSLVSVYNVLGGNKDIRKVIDIFYNKLKGKPVVIED
jgi:hypothetical protein